ncbi:MAG: hypothetical protein ACLP1Q_15640 [Solirubrobacteraceae bacterium]
MDEQAELSRFGQKIGQVREREGVSIAELAARSGVDVTQINASKPDGLIPRLT